MARTIRISPTMTIKPEPYYVAKCSVCGQARNYNAYGMSRAQVAEWAYAHTCANVTAFAR